MENQGKTHKKKFITSRGQKIMLIGISVCIIISIAMFTFLGLFMGNKTQETVDDIGEKSMTETSNQFSLHFDAILTERLTMVEAFVKDYVWSVEQSEKKPEEYKILSDEQLAEMAEHRGFEYMGFLDVLGTLDDEESLKHEDARALHQIIKRNFIVTDIVSFRKAILRGEKRIAIGCEKENRAQQVVMFSFPTDKYPMDTERRHSLALVAGMTLENFLGLFDINSINGENTISYIVRHDSDATNGETNSLIFKGTRDEGLNNLSEVFRKWYSDSDIPVSTLLGELNEQMRVNEETGKNEPYSNMFHVGSKYIHMYAVKLNQSQWYLVTLTNNASLGESITELNDLWTAMTISSVVIIVAILVSIFIMYSYYNRKTMKQLDRARKDAVKANKAKSEFLSNMSHDIRTPMNAIVGMTSIASANIENRAQVQDCLKKIALSSRHLLGLINDVLDMSKIESGKMTLNMEQISLREVMDGISTIVQPQIKIKEQKFDVYIHDMITENVYCDSVRLNQVLLNLLSNAVKFTPEHGTIEVALRQEPSPLGDDFVRNYIDVSDTGIGMTKEFQERIFESFTREDSTRVHKTEGTGLGMTITKYIIDSMKGAISLESELGKGTKFHVVLDLEKVDEVQEEMILPDWNMLVVDDDEQLCRTTVASLKSIGVRGDWTLTGEEAVKMTVKAHESGARYDIILLDWKLPGIDGLETARQIRRKLGDDIPILLISAYDWSDMEKEAREAGINGFISKPLFKSTLYYGLRKFTSDFSEKAGDGAAEEGAEDFGGKRILIAEDNDLNWEIAEMLLKEEGFVVDRAENGKICVDMVKNAAPGTYDAVLMDIRMPVMTGYEATEAIRALDHPDKDIPIIAMTADAFADDVKKCLACGMNTHISKPIDMNMLKAALKRYMK